MNSKYKALFKYEFKKLIWLFFAMVLFFILYSKLHSRSVVTEINYLITDTNNLSLDFKIFEPEFVFFYAAIVFILVYIQFNDGFNKLWHSLPFTNKEVLSIKLITGTFTIFSFVAAACIIMLRDYYTYAEIYKDALTVLNINPALINPLFIFKVMLSVFVVYLFMYFFTVLIQYIVGNCLSGICLSILLIHIPVLVLAGLNIFIKVPSSAVFTILPHYICSDVNLYDVNFFTNDAFEWVNAGIFSKYSIYAVIYYTILSILSLFILIRVAVLPKWIEQSSPFSKNWIKYIFIAAFVIDFAMLSINMMYNIAAPAKIITAVVFAVIGYIIAEFIIKRQGVNI